LFLSFSRLQSQFTDMCYCLIVKVFIVIKRANNHGRYFKEQETEISISQTDRQTPLSNLFPIHFYISKR